MNSNFSNLFEKKHHQDKDLEGKTAAVAVVFLENNTEPKLLMIKRAIRIGDPWSGHMAFPGGRFQAEDKNMNETAIRETWEEVGLRPKDSSWCGSLPLVAPLAAKEVAVSICPYLFVIKEEPELTLNHEVQDIFWLPLSFFFDAKNSDRFEYEWQGKVFNLPCFRYQDEVIWGLSYRILVTLLDRILECREEFSEFLPNDKNFNPPWTPFTL